MSEAAAKNTQCLHPFVWPNGDCVECGVLATTLPGHTEPTHISLPRKFTPLIDKYEAQINELEKALNRISLIADTAQTNKEGIAIDAIQKIIEDLRAESVLKAGGKQ